MIAEYDSIKAETRRKIFKLIHYRSEKSGELSVSSMLHSLLSFVSVYVLVTELNEAMLNETFFEEKNENRIFFWSGA